VSLLRVSEFFTSLQGEGASAGEPAVFLRLGDCNLSCTYCDTRYSWDWEHYRRRDELAEQKVVDVAGRIRACSPRRLVITGGEPLLQQASVEDLLSELAGYFVEVETNGTLLPGATLARRVDQWNVSPKLSNSGVRQCSRIKPDVLAVLRDTQRAWLKFVVAEPEQVTEVIELITAVQWPSHRVILMPQALDAIELATRSVWVAQAAIARGFRFSTRLHLLLWGNSRGR
jgi:organic radical activating enzyme